ELNKNDELVKENERVHLTQREIEIIQLIEKEMSNKQIAAHLFLSEKTVETHRKNIYRKTETNSLIGLVKFAYEHHIITSHK
ncbi:MAG: LuxR C-terminal-related transcriptional regulator, partial [Ginsengibacter sp.]